MPHHGNVNSRSVPSKGIPVDTPAINGDLCIACGSCVDFCPGGAVRIEDGRATVVDPEACTYCTECEAICPTGAIQCPFTVVLIEKTHP